MDKLPAAVNLRCHSEYSLASGMLRLSGEKNLGQLAASRGIGALALTDDNSISGALKFFRCCKEAGVKPILGCQARLAWGEADEEFRLSLLVRDQAGFISLSRLLSQAQENENRRGVIDAGQLSDSNTAGLAVLAGFESDLVHALRRNEAGGARRLAGRWREMLGDYYFPELSLAGRAGEEPAAVALARFAAAERLPALAAHPALFADRQDFTVQEIRACIASGHRLDDPDRPRPAAPEQYLLSAAEMAETFKHFPGALENACQLAQACNWDFAEAGTADLPRLDDIKDADEQLRSQAEAGLAQLGLTAKPEYRQRLEREMAVIIKQGFAGYYLIVADFVGFAKERAIPVGPGRGSGAGSLVAYCLRITDIDPLVYGLLFERFLNPERISMPDFDIDFCMDRREEVIEYVRKKHGAASVSQIATFGTLGAKAVVRDVGRVLGLPYTQCDELARLIPGELNVTLDSAFKDVEQLREKIGASERLGQLWEYALALEGLPRNAGTHAGGVLIAPRPLAEFCPLMHVGDAGGGMVSQFDKDDLSAIGLIKFDFLGLRTLTMIQYAIDMIRKDGRPDFDFADLDLDDKDTYRIYCETDTIGVFQCEAPGMRDVMRRMQPTSLEDIAALISLYRPGPIKSGMTKGYLSRRAGEDESTYPHPKAKPILKPTYGTIVFQEQVLQLAQQLADFSLGQADVLRKAMGSKDPQIMEKARNQFVEGAAATLGSKPARQLYDAIAEFAGYAFNKAHAVGYAILSVQTAYLKVHHRTAFYAALLSTNFQDQAALAKFGSDAANHGIRLLAPDVSCSRPLFFPEGEKEIRIGLASVRGVGRQAAETICAARHNGPFESMADMCSRCDSGLLNRNALENLIRAGACDCLTDSRSPGQARSLLMADLPTAQAAAMHSRIHHNQQDMFGNHPDTPAARTASDPWPKMKVLEEEYKALGLTVSGHFFEEVRWMLSSNRQIRSLYEIEERMQAVFAGCILAIKTPPALRKQGVEIVSLDDGRDQIDMRIGAAARPDGPLRGGDIVICTATARKNHRGEMQLYAEQVHLLRDYWSKMLRKITVQVSEKTVDLISSRLESWHKGSGCQVGFRLATAGCEGEIRLGERRIPDFESVSLLGEAIDPKNIKLVYQ